MASGISNIMAGSWAMYEDACSQDAGTAITENSISYRVSASADMLFAFPTPPGFFFRCLFPFYFSLFI